jgi:glutaminyl-tRNA synthetase
MRAYRGTLTEPGRDSPYRDRSVEENLDLFRRMRAGEFADGSRVLRAKIDMASPNINLRDPVMYRILHAPTTAPATPGASTRCTTGPTARATPSRASPTRSARWSSRTTARSTTGSRRRWACPPPQQIEFARLNLTYTVMSKRKLLQAGAKEGHVSGWDDPRMPTLAGLRRRGYTPGGHPRLRDGPAGSAVAMQSGADPCGCGDRCWRAGRHSACADPVR